MPNQTTNSRRVTVFLASPLFFRIIVGLLVVQALWIALSGRYPMAFDEDFHLGIIRLYAHHLSPFWAGQPENANMFGAVARDPSYLYHWLMSFPYRLISLCTQDQTIQVLLLRFINIGLFTSGVVLMRRLLLKTGVSKAVLQTSLLFFVLLPIVPLLAAQINYDNLLLPALVSVMLLTVAFLEELQRYGRIHTKRLLLIIILCLLASLIKYAFLPIFLALMLVITASTWRKQRTLRKSLEAVYFGWSLITSRARWALVAMLFTGLVLFGQRYGVNIVRYHKPVVDCGEVLTVKQCSEYGPWIRDYALKSSKTSVQHSSPPSFNYEWFYGMWFRTFFAVDGPGTRFETRGPLLLPALAGLIFFFAGVLAVAFMARRLWRRASNRTVWTLFGAVTAVYIGILWFDEYQAYLRTGQPVAINGRYLLPVLPFVLLLIALAFNELLRRHRQLKLGLLVVACVCLLWGGGAMTYVLRGRDAWYWPNSPTASVNRELKTTLGPLVPGFAKPTLFLR